VEEEDQYFLPEESESVVPEEEEMEKENVYMQQVMQQKAEVERDLRVKRKAAPVFAARRGASAGMMSGGFAEGGGGGPESEGPAVDVRVTGWWRFQNVVVPPNAYVVHTRRDVKDPLHCGLGLSFRFNPVTDSFLVAPATMQTIIINANCICKERQGILVQGYVQWIIDDFSRAYKKLDFSDPVDPMRVTNVQLREQAEATIKDTVAMMSIDQVLADKQPIIKTLTQRLEELVGGDGKDEGLGLRIVTVQIKEAVVSSPRVWSTLQKSYRAEQGRNARLAELESQAKVKEKEAEAKQQAARLEIETQEEIGKRRSEAEAETFDRNQNETARRAQIEAELMAQADEFNKEKIEREAALDALRLKKQIEAEEIQRDADLKRRKKEIEMAAARQKVENDVSDGLLRARLIEALPSILSQMPRPDEFKSVTFGEGDGLNAAVASVLDVLDKFGSRAAPDGQSKAARKAPRKK
jgi:regulator of protease activity HflC (stomatin/prohibitin superfamily)